MTWVFQFTSGRRLVIALGVAVLGGSVVFGVGPFPYLQTVAPGGLLPETQLGYGGQQLIEFLENLGAEGRTEYQKFQYLDFLTPLLLGCPAVLGIAFLLKKVKEPHGIVAWLPAVPFLLLVTEVVENSILLSAVYSYPVLPSSVTILAVMTGTKFLSMGLISVTLLGSFVRSKL